MKENSLHSDNPISVMKDSGATGQQGYVSVRGRWDSWSPLL